VIGISMLTLNQEAAGGTLTYAREFIRALARVGELDYRVFVPSTAPDAGDGLPTTVVHEYRASRSRTGRVAGLAVAAFSPGPLRRALRPAELNAIHFPLGVMLPRLEAPSAATTIHDLQHEEFPEFFSRAQLAYRRAVYGWTVRKSRIVITDSEHGRQVLVERLRLNPERVRAIHLAVDHRRFTPDGSPREPFLLYPANSWPHKNHQRLFEAFALVRAERPELTLVLTGAGHRRLPIPAGVQSRGHVPFDELVRLYRTAAALVFPSLYEGFGIPCLEAMACDCPVAVSRVASLPEVCGEAAVYVDPLSVESIAQGIRDVLDRPPEGGVQRAARFTWAECARRHEDVYRELAAASPGFAP
jgi:glycosyltransferase involved in cell wall biosynthesis